MADTQMSELVIEKFTDVRAFPQKGAIFTTTDVNLITAQPGTQKVMTGASISALAANPLRKYATFVNLSDNPIALGLGAAAVAGTGIVLTAKGSSYEITKGNLFLGEVYAIGTNADLLGVTEGT